MEINKNERIGLEGIAVVLATMVLILGIYLMYPNNSLGNRVDSAIAMSFTIMAIYLFDKTIVGSMICFMTSELIHVIISTTGYASVELLLTLSGILIALIRVTYKVRWKEQFKKSSLLDKLDGIIYYPMGGIKLSSFYSLVLIGLVVISCYSISSNSSDGQGALIQLLQIISVYLPTMLLMVTILNLKLAQYIRLFSYSLTMTMGVIIAYSTGDRVNFIGSLEYLVITAFTIYVIWRDTYINDISYKTDKELYLEVMDE